MSEYKTFDIDSRAMCWVFRRKKRHGTIRRGKAYCNLTPSSVRRVCAAIVRLSEQKANKADD